MACNMEFTITSQQILWICRFIASVYGVYKIVKELKKPSDDLKETVKRHTELLHRDNERLNSLEKITLNQEGINRKLEEHTRILSDHDERLEEDKKRGDLMLKANMAILDGMLSEDDKESLKATRKEIQDFLVEKNYQKKLNQSYQTEKKKVKMNVILKLNK